MLKQLNENELKELHIIHQVIGQLSLAHRPVAWRGIPKDEYLAKLSINTLAYLSKIHSETENIMDVLIDPPYNDINSYKKELKVAIYRADEEYSTVELHPGIKVYFDNIRKLLEI
ncbi:hypothetical protein ACF91D_28555 [Staphylococcus sp. 231237_7MaSpsaltlick]|uniref:hypothetical protein n=1 Tax=Staphylococcus TaxID=1279 RepID=UPI00370B1E06